ncbi:MAG: sigma-70 family RNA polymerase sigma factor [Clostridia bacterium]|nr:sigma-70 family RNA polymerase sigma factor [Clostridia bacterium]MBQ2241796.1 sigma-70 family RNA polymerase sigma factor [Clostridia bacterium]
MFTNIFLRVRLFFARFLARFNKGNGIYYVNGPDTLPPPLTAEEENEAITEFELTGNRVIRGLLIERNLRLVVYIARKFESTGIGIEDLVSIGTIGLIKAIGSFRSDKGIKLATYASRCIENEILMYIRKHSQTKCEVSLDEPLNVDWDGNELLLSDVLDSGEESVCEQFAASEERIRVRRAVAALAPRERQIIELRYGLTGKRELTQKEVADLLGISQSYISRLEKRIIEGLRREMMGKI